jgi:hypothetical protein
MTVRNVARWALVVLIAGTSLPFAVPAQQQSGESCPGVRWEAPAEWRSPDGYRLYGDVATVVPFRGRSLWLTQMLVVWDTGRVMRYPLLEHPERGVRSSQQITMGAVIGPRGEWRYVSMPPDLEARAMYPRVAVDRSNIAHVVWAGADSLSASMFEYPRHIWYARFDGEHWSQPEVVQSGRGYMWNQAHASRLVMQGDTLHFAVTTLDGSNIYVHGVNGHWMTRIVDVPRRLQMLGYPRIAVLPNRRIVLIAQGIAIRPPEKLGLSGVYATWSDDGGESWVPPVLVSSRDAEPAYDMQLLPEVNGVLRAFWYQVTDTLGHPSTDISLSGAPGRIHLAESIDGGQSWRQLPASELLPSGFALDVLQMDINTVLVVLVDRRKARLPITTWSGVWRPFSFINAQADPMFAFLGRYDAQRLVLTWGTVEGPPTWFLSRVTTLTPCH